ncbi:MAG: hypothetical protein H8D45_04050 [Bacteroidetes bacterium]|nr:hypothetical protein [Bacteroidota bacterium]
MNITTIRKTIENIKLKGFVPTQRKGPTGVGYTLEKLIGLNENNIILPDFGAIELKAMRENSINLITMLTFNRGVWQFSQVDIINKFGYLDVKRQRQALYSSVINIPNNQGLYTAIDDQYLYLKHNSDVVIGIWDINHIRERLIDKIQTVLLVKAIVDYKEGKEHFLYHEASIVTGCDNNGFFSLINTGKVILDLRMHIKDSGSARNHGTGFRIYEKHLEELYLNKTRLV